MSLVSTYKQIKEMDRISISLIAGTIYAISDEIHQCFTPGRGPLVTDVIIDGMGVLLGIFLVMLFLKIWYSFRKTKTLEKL